MLDAVAILHKELKELTRERDTRRAGVVQIAFAALILGVLVPLRRAEQWDMWTPTVLIPYVVIASVLATTVAADAFAGERERQTLETLMTTPVSEFAILLGKVVTVVLFGLAVAMVSWTVTIAVAAARGVPLAPILPLTIACAWLSVCSTFFFGTLAIGVSLQSTSARASQQISSVLTLVVFAVGSLIWQALSLPLTTGPLCLAGVVAMALGGLGLRVLSRWFRRERLFCR